MSHVMHRGTGTSAGKIAEFVNGGLRGDPDLLVSGPCSLARPRASHLCFATRLKALEGAGATAAGAVVLAPAGAAAVTGGTVIEVSEPRLAFAEAATEFFVPRPPASIAASTRIDRTAIVGERVSIGENTVVGPDVVIGDDTVIRHHVVLARGVRVGARCLINSGTVVGEEGFGMAKRPDGRNVRLPHFGSVVIGDDVEIGALTTIVGGTIDPTVIEDGAKIDDHVHIAHNVRVGRDALVIACAEVSGSVQVGEGVWIGPNASVIDGISIPPGTTIGIGTTVIRSLDQPGVYVGSPGRLLRATTDARSDDG